LTSSPCAAENFTRDDNPDIPVGAKQALSALPTFELIGSTLQNGKRTRVDGKIKCPYFSAKPPLFFFNGRYAFRNGKKLLAQVSTGEIVAGGDLTSNTPHTPHFPV